MKLTTEWLTEQQACQDGMAWFTAQTETDSIKVVRKLHLNARNDWANWLIVRLMNRTQRLKYVINAAELALPIGEKQYPEDKRARLAIEAARAVLANDTEETRKLALKAYYAAAATTYAYTYAYTYTYSAAAATYAYTYFAGAATYAYTYYAADAAGIGWNELLEYGIGLLESEEKNERNI